MRTIKNTEKDKCDINIIYGKQFYRFFFFVGWVVCKICVGHEKEKFSQMDPCDFGPQKTKPKKCQKEKCQCFQVLAVECGSSLARCLLIGECCLSCGFPSIHTPQLTINPQCMQQDIKPSSPSGTWHKWLWAAQLQDSCPSRLVVELTLQAKMDPSFPTTHLTKGLFG